MQTENWPIKQTFTVFKRSFRSHQEGARCFLLHHCTEQDSTKDKAPQLWSETSYYLIFSLDDGLKQALLGAVEWKAAREEDEEDDSTSPHVHWFAVRLPLHNLGGHEVRRTDST